MKRLTTRLLAAAGALTLTVGLINPEAAQAAATMPTPILDPFFNVPAAQYVHKPHGKLLRSRKLPAFLVPGGSATQMVFSTRDTFNRPTYATAVLVKPANFPKNGKVVVFNDFINSLGIGCQPSFSYSNLNPEWNTRSFIAMWYAAIAARYGYALLIPDHEGMKAAYTANILAGHIVLDAVRAMKNTPSFGMQRSWTGMLGYSGGSMVSLWAANLRAEYAPDVHFGAIAVGGTPTDLQYYGVRFGNRPNDAFGLAFASLVGLEREYPRSMRVTPRLSKHGKNKMRVLKDACSPRLLQSLKGESVNTIFSGVSLNPAQERSAFRVLRENSLYYDQRHPTRGTKLYVFGSRTDIGAPIRPLRATMHRYCATGSRIQYVEVNDPNHVSTAFYNIPAAAQWLFQMSNGGKMRNDCRRIPR
ncbi:MAG: lipase family protein [Lawsonella sp.]|uniref:lipase family protein n=1 Tax=Lawsonella sp. TaxID=2041415 RepID=UPI002A761E18|nr:lipase family protein [Lawsonella sp.]MDY2979309.1 lipase family protein [Lawsonella sp.]